MKNKSTSTASIPERIVAEATANWVNGKREPADGPLLCQTFEQIIARNRERGYELESWQFRQAIAGEGTQHCTTHLNETIIAVFKRQTDGEAATKTTRKAPPR